MEKSITLTKEEQDEIEINRKIKEKNEICIKEIQEVLNKYGMTMQVQSNPQIIIIPQNKTNK